MLAIEQNFLMFFVVSAPFFGSCISTILTRAQRQQTILNPVFSNCSKCCHHLPFFHKIPILSYIALKGKCSFCGISINWIHITFEIGFLISSLLAVAILFNQTFGVILLTIFLAWIFIPLSTFDIQNKRLPDIITVPIACAGFLQGYFLPYVMFFDCLVGFLLGFALGTIVSVSYSRIRHQTGLGWGDVKLIAAIGAWIGWQFVPWFILLASMSALTYGIFQIIKHGKHMANERIPFGPFLCGSSWLVWLYTIS